MSNAVASEAGPVSGQVAGRVRVPLLSELLDGSANAQRRVWADLGAVQRGLIEHLTPTRSRLLVVDLPAARVDGFDGWHRPDSVLDTSFWRDPVDCFLCWDLPNYMQRDELGELAEAIARRGHAGARVHALIQYSGHEMPVQPGRYCLEPDLWLTDSTPPGGTVPTPRYSPTALAKAMPELKVERTMLLNNGMQEFLFRVDDSG